MFIVKVFRQTEGDLGDYADAYLDVDLEVAKIAACARLDGAQARGAASSRPLNAHIYLMSAEGPNLKVCHLIATEHGAIEFEERLN